MKMPMNALDGTRFSKGSTPGLIVAEASDVGFRRCERIFDDACDVGVRIRGKTGVEIDFALQGEDRNAEGEIAGWRFIPATKQDERRANGVKEVLIIND